MLEPKDIERLEKRASAAIHGHCVDVNITPYVYGQDVTALLNEVVTLKLKVKGLERKVENHK